MDSRSTTRVAVIVLLVAVVGALSASARSQPAAKPVTETQPTEILKWNRIAMNTLLATAQGGAMPAAVGAPPASQILLGMTQGAVYDAVNAIHPKHYRPYLLTRRFSARASREAAVATAAFEVLSSIVQGVPQTIAFPNRDALLESLAAEYADSLDAIDDSPFKDQGIAAGHAAAEVMIAAREGDGRYGPSQWVPNPLPGYWDPTLPDGTTQQDPTPWVGGVKPFLLQSPSQFRTPGPNALTSAAYTVEFNEVKALGSVNSAQRTQFQTDTAIFWTGAGGPSWGVVARDLIANPAYEFDLFGAARLLAMMGLASADAAINCWNDKYHWNFWRPVHAVNRAADDGNPDTSPQLGWMPLRTAPYPDHPSGHMCLDGANLRALQIFLGTDDIPLTISTRVPGLAPRSYANPAEILSEIESARVWAGLHFRTADVQGGQLGRNVAEYMAANYFHPVG
jgi:hypothetical protein